MCLQEPTQSASTKHSRQLDLSGIHTNRLFLVLNNTGTHGSTNIVYNGAFDSLGQYGATAWAVDPRSGDYKFGA